MQHYKNDVAAIWGGV